MIQNVRCGLFLSKQQTNVLTENMYRWNNLCLFELDDQAIAQLHFRVMKCRKWHSLKKDVRPFITVTSNCDNLHTKYRHKHFKLMKHKVKIFVKVEALSQVVWDFIQVWLISEPILYKLVQHTKQLNWWVGNVQYMCKCCSYWYHVYFLLYT